MGFVPMREAERVEMELRMERMRAKTRYRAERVAEETVALKGLWDKGLWDKGVVISWV